MCHVAVHVTEAPVQFDFFQQAEEDQTCKNIHAKKINHLPEIAECVQSTLHIQHVGVIYTHHQRIDMKETEV